MRGSKIQFIEPSPDKETVIRKIKNIQSAYKKVYIRRLKN